MKEWFQRHIPALDKDDREFIYSVLPLVGFIVVLAAGGVAWDQLVKPIIETANLVREVEAAARRVIFECLPQSQISPLTMFTTEGASSSLLDDVRVVASNQHVDLLSERSAVVSGDIWTRVGDAIRSGFVRMPLPSGQGQIVPDIKAVCSAVQISGSPVLP